VLGWPRRPEGEGSTNPPDFVLLFCSFSKKKKKKKKKLSKLSGREPPTAVYLTGDPGSVILAEGTRSKGWGDPLHPLGARAQLGITYPGKEAWKDREPCRSYLESNYRVLIKTKEARSFALLCGLSVFLLLLFFF
jgi:hypothetical protein